MKGGNIPAHEEANRKATEIAGPKVQVTNLSIISIHSNNA